MTMPQSYYSTSSWRNRLATWVLNLFGWKLLYTGLPARHGVIVAYPHTSNWDFCVGILAKWAMGIPASFLAKHTLFNIPVFGTWLKRVGGLPIDRRNPQGSVEQLKQLILQTEELWILFTPEGTRKKTPGWRSGFYRLAKQAQLPIGVAVLDFKNKEVGIVEFFEPSDNEDVDLEILRQIYAGRVGCRPELASPIIFWSPSAGDS